MGQIDTFDPLGRAGRPSPASTKVWTTAPQPEARAHRCWLARPGGGGDGDDESWRHARTVEAARCGELLGFLDDLAGRLGECPSTWVAWAGWATSLLRRVVGGADAIETWARRRGERR